MLPATYDKGVKRNLFIIAYTNVSMEEKTIQDSEFGEIPTHVLTDSMIEALQGGK